MSTTESLQGTTVIVGAGIFGTSTAYHLSQSGNGTIIIIDQNGFPTPGADSAEAPLGASYDINKIVRADYTSKFHMKMALEAIERWRSWDVISPFYHQTGWIVVGDHGDGTVEVIETMRQNFRECKDHDDVVPLSIEELKQVASGSFRDINQNTFERAYSNPEVAWAEADKAVNAMLSKAIENGVKYSRGKVERIILDSASTGVKGVTLHDGSVIDADRILLATGAWTSALMDGIEESLDLPDNERAESQLKAAAVCNVHFSLPPGETDRYMDIPIFVKGSLGEVLPPPKSRLLKINNSTSFTNTVKTKSGRNITCPAMRSQFDVPETLKKETLDVVREVIPQVLTDELKMDFFRVCWDAITPEQHQLITRHPSPHLKNLFFAVGGSFHGWKFLPTIGHYATNVLCGRSNGKEMDETWGWKWGGWSGATGEGAHAGLVPQREFHSFLEAKNNP